ncbi:MAG TPA: winged helix-turn-helix domain-containing protein [Candidatus Sulfotelmatobacter sp.]|nr:winged helix-turn-helix domain-containing protein [Candidatus Sulfotelmatobacter sp.]
MGTSPVPSGQQSILQFGPFQLDSANWELRKHGQRISLAPQAFTALAFLTSHSGNLVTREDLRREIWGPDTFVDFEQGLNFCVWTLRAALGDDPKTPRYIETVARRGYRFLSRVTRTNGTRVSHGAPCEAVRAFPTANRYTGGRGRLAVSYFSDLTGEPIGASLAAALRELLLTELVADKSLVLIQPSREAIAEAVLEGALVCSAGRILLALRAADPRSGEYVWGSVRPICAKSGPSDVEDAVSRLIAELKEKLFPVAFSTRRVPSRSEIFEAYLEARRLCDRRTDKDLRNAIRRFEFIGRRDPSFAPTFSGQALAGAVLAGMSPAGRLEWEEKVCASAHRAIELDPGQADAHAALALVESLYKLDWTNARKALEKAVELDVNQPTSHQWLSMALAAEGQGTRALQEISVARWLDPGAPIIAANHILFLYLTEQYQQAMEICRQACSRNPKFPWLRMQLGLLLERRLRPEEALAQMEKAAWLSGGQPNMLAALCRTYVRTGNAARGREIVGQLKSAGAKSTISAYGIAACYSAIGEKEECLEWLGKACDQREFTAAMLPVDPLFDTLWDDRGFRALARQFGFALFNNQSFSDQRTTAPSC